MATHSSTIAWKIPWMEEPGRLQSMGLWRVGHEWATSLSLFTHALEKEMATHSSILAWRIPGTEEPGGLPSMGSHRVGHDEATQQQQQQQYVYLNPQLLIYPYPLSLSGNSVYKESACNAGDPDLIPGSERSTGEVIGHHYSVLGLPLWLNW